MLNIVQVRRGLGLKAYELAALIGSDHTTISRVEHSPGHRPGTNMLYWLLKQYGIDGIRTALDYWLHFKPKHVRQINLLIRIARRYKGDHYGAWMSGIQVAHPEFFSPLKRAA